MGNFVTINIESTELRFLVTNGKQVKRWGSAPLEPGVVKDGIILDPEALRGAIDELIVSKQLRRGNVIASLSSFQSVHRIIELPKLPSKLLGEAIIGEAKRAMPISLEQIYLSWQDISEKEADLQRFFLLGVPRNMLNAQVQCLQQAGLNPVTINLKPLALAKMANRSNALILDIEHESCTILVIADGIPAIMRSVVLNPEYPLADRAQYALQEFERTLQYYESSYLDNPLSPETPLYLSGELADAEEMVGLITSGVGYPIEPLPCPLECPPDFPLSQFAVNIGLAARGGASKAKDSDQDDYFRIHSLNILPDVYRPTPPSMKRVLAVVGVIVGLGLIYPLYMLVDSANDDVKDREDELAQVQQAIVERQKDIAEAQQIQAAIQQVDQQSQALQAGLGSLNVSTLRATNERAYLALDLAIRDFERITHFGTLPSITLDLSQKQITLGGQIYPFEVAEDGKLKLDIDDHGMLGLLGGDEDYHYYNEFNLLTDYASQLRDRPEWFSNVSLQFLRGGEAPTYSETDLLGMLQDEVSAWAGETLEKEILQGKTLEQIQQMFASLEAGAPVGASEPDEMAGYSITMTINGI